MPRDYLNEISRYDPTTVPWKDEYTRTLSAAPHELATLCYWIDFMEIKTYLEVGTAGGALMHFFMGYMGLNVYGIDQGSPLMISDDLLFKGDSKSQAAIDWAIKRAPFDMVYIDADHHYESVVSDFNNYGSLSKKIVAFHDISHQHVDGVRKFWDKLDGMKLEVIVPGVGKGTGILFLKGN